VSAAEEGIKAVGGQSYFVSVDASDEESVKAGFTSVRENLGEVDVLVYNASGGMVRKPILELSAQDFQRCWNIDCLGALFATKAVLPSMITKKQGTLLFTSATGAFRGSKNNAPFGVAKFSLRALCQSIAKEHAVNGIHVAHVRIDGVIDIPSTRKMLNWPDEKFVKPDDLANTYYSLHLQSPSAWTNELDVRPFTEEWTC